jgi:hypothetical protein
VFEKYFGNPSLQILKPRCSNSGSPGMYVALRGYTLERRGRPSFFTWLPILFHFFQTKQCGFLITLWKRLSLVTSTDFLPESLID